MKAVARLVYLYFFGAAGLRWLSGAGLISVAVCVGLWRWRPDWLPAIIFGCVGVAAVFVGTTLMPVMIARMASGHWSATVPYLRLKLFVSALLTVLLVALPVLILAYAGVGQTGTLYAKSLTPAALAAVRTQNIQLMWAAFLGAANLFTWLYVVGWLASSRSSLWGPSRALVVLALVLFGPVMHIAILNVWGPLRLCVTWAVFAALFPAWPRWKALGIRLSRGLLAAIPARRGMQDVRASSSQPVRPRPSSIPRHATDLVLGTDSPWLMAAGLCLPMLMVVRMSTSFPGAWLYCQVLLSTSSAAIAGQAALRSRALWLAGGWSRVELFRQAERAFWRYNLIVLGVVLIVTIAVDVYVGVASRTIALGISLLSLGTALGTYLGLMVTRGMRWQETILTVGVMLALMACALIASHINFSSMADVARLIGLAVALVFAAVAFRGLSRRRWEHLDWTECRSERVIRARMA
jgi:uncharacterized membrane protein (DUF441 family)